MKIKHKIPNVLTLLNLALGVVSILLVVDNRGPKLTVFACLLILAAALTDRFDGKLARRFDAESNLGRELDSLADLVSFGIAPVVLSWRTCFINMGILGYVIAIVFPLAGAYRLARFNVMQMPIVFEEEESEHTEDMIDQEEKKEEAAYNGLPITVAGAFLILINLFNFYLWNSDPEREYLIYLNKVITTTFTLLLSFLMVSKIRIRKR